MTTTAAPLDAIVTALRDHGCNPRQSRPGQWNSRCPNTAAHSNGDRHPSLSVGEGADGRALIHCQTGCPPSAVLNALDLTWPATFPPPPANGTNGHTKPRVVDRYDYLNIDGELVFQVERLDPKGFRQRRPTPDGWAYNLNGIDQRPLYRAPQVAAADTVWVVEGEKDVHALERLGWTATTNSGGAGKWRSEHTAALAGKHVHIVADDDQPGREHAQTVSSALQGIAASVAIYLPHQGHKDIAEHLGAGRRIEELRHLPDHVEPPQSNLLIDWDEFWAKDRKTEEWLAWPLIPRGRQVALYAPAKTGKSIITLAALAALAAGRPVFGQPAQPPVHVLYLDYEMTEDDLYERLEALGYGPHIDLSHLHYALLPSLPPLDTPAGADAVCDLADQTAAEAVAVDTMGRAVQGDENDSTPYREFARLTGLRFKQAGRALLRTDHAGKSREKGQRGSSAKADDVDLVYRLDANDDGYTLTRTHTRISWAPDRTVITRSGGNGQIVEFVATRQARTYVPGTKDAADRLDQLAVPNDWGRIKVRARLAELGEEMTVRLVDDAIRYRKERSRDPSDLI